LHWTRPSAGRPFTQACNKIVTAAARNGQSVLHIGAAGASHDCAPFGQHLRARRGNRGHMKMAGPFDPAQWFSFIEKFQTNAGASA